MATKNKSTKVLRGDSPMLFIYSIQRASTDADVNTSMLFSVYRTDMSWSAMLFSGGEGEV